jgi:hypothetical protein
MRAPARLVLAAALAALALLAAAGPAAADGDPASDILLVDTVYFPYGGVSDGARQMLRDAVDASTQAGYPVRVALIADKSDLGAVTVLWGQPRKYARFLSLELTLLYKGPLLIVMPSGIGFAHVKHATAAEYRALAPIRVAPGRDGLAETAARAVQALAGRAGHPIELQRGGSGGSTVWIAAGAAAAGLVAAAAAGLFLRRRLRSR